MDSVSFVRGGAIRTYDSVEFETIDELRSIFKGYGAKSIGLMEESEFDSSPRCYKTVPIDELGQEHLDWVNKELRYRASRDLKLYGN